MTNYSLHISYKWKALYLIDIYLVLPKFTIGNKPILNQHVS